MCMAMGTKLIFLLLAGGLCAPDRQTRPLKGLRQWLPSGAVSLLVFTENQLALPLFIHSRQSGQLVLP